MERGDDDATAELRLRAAFEALGNPMLMVDDRRRYVTANASACGLLGIPPHEVRRHGIDDFALSPDRVRLAEQWDAFLVYGGLEGLLHLSLPTGKLVPTEFSVTTNVVPGRHLMVVMPRDEPAAEANAGGAGWLRLVSRDADQQSLTAREKQVIALVAEGLQGGEIATRLFVSPETVKSHVQNAMTKLGAHTRAHAVAIALSTGQIDLTRQSG